MASLHEYQSGTGIIENAKNAVFSDLANEWSHIQDLHMTYSSDNVMYNNAVMEWIGDGDAEIDQREDAIFRENHSSWSVSPDKWL
jgi:hypothetical protein